MNMHAGFLSVYKYYFVCKQTICYEKRAVKSDIAWASIKYNTTENIAFKFCVIQTCII